MLIVAFPCGETHFIVSNIEYRQHVSKECDSEDMRPEITVHETHAAQRPGFLISGVLAKQVFGADIKRLGAQLHSESRYCSVARRIPCSVGVAVRRRRLERVEDSIGEVCSSLVYSSPTPIQLRGYHRDET